MPLKLNGVPLLASRMLKILEELSEPITYGELCKRIHLKFGIRYRRNSKWVSRALYEVMKTDILNGVPLKSALVVGEHSRIPGEGFFCAARELGYEFVDNEVFFHEILKWVQNPNEVPDSLRHTNISDRDPIDFTRIKGMYVSLECKGPFLYYMHGVEERSEDSLFFTLKDASIRECFNCTLWRIKDSDEIRFTWNDFAIEEGSFLMSFQERGVDRDIILRGTLEEQILTMFLLIE